MVLKTNALPLSYSPSKGAVGGPIKDRDPPPPPPLAAAGRSNGCGPALGGARSKMGPPAPTLGAGRPLAAYMCEDLEHPRHNIRRAKGIPLRGPYIGTRGFAFGKVSRFARRHRSRAVDGGRSKINPHTHSATTAYTTGSFRANPRQWTPKPWARRAPGPARRDAPGIRLCP